MKFLERFLSGEGSADDIDQEIDNWHSSPEDHCPLHEYLGMTLKEYNAWVERPSSLRRHRPFPNAPFHCQDCSWIIGYHYKDTEAPRLCPERPAMPVKLPSPTQEHPITLLHTTRRERATSPWNWAWVSYKLPYWSLACESLWSYPRGISHRQQIKHLKLAVKKFLRIKFPDAHPSQFQVIVLGKDPYSRERIQIGEIHELEHR